MKKKRIQKTADTIRKAQGIFTVHEMIVYSGHAALCILMAMIPLLILVIAAVNRLPGFSAEETAMAIFEHVRLVPEVRTMLESMIHNLNQQSGSFVASLSAIATLVSASRGISAIQLGLKTMQHEPKHFLRDKGIALLFTLLYIVMIPALLIFQLFEKAVLELITAVTGLLSLPDITGSVLTVFEYSGILLIALNFFVILLTYTYLPGGKHNLKEYMPGALFTAVIWELFTAAFAFFIPRFWKASAVYGSLAALFLSALWLKIIIAILFFGEAFNQANTDTKRSSEPSDDQTLTGAE
ncbi:MAG: YihY/virulence factor BrkB family protein [Solobacterium sp.]|nr:YihY/virulence factor BrkB family protein [Solobacterium sp.]